MDTFNIEPETEPTNDTPAVAKSLPIPLNTPITLTTTAMRTRWEFWLPDDGHADPTDLRAAGEEALEEIEFVEVCLSAFLEIADIARANEGAARHPVRIHPFTLTLLEHAKLLSQATDGAFDPTVGPLLRYWNLYGGNGDIPTPEQVADALALVGLDKIKLYPNTARIRYLKPGVALDMGAIGKGAALDRADAFLREVGVTSALLHSGTSTICAIGTPPDRQGGWPIAIQHPLLPNAHLTTVLLEDNALSVSAVHGKSFYAKDGRRFGHIIDPRTGWPVQDTLLAAAVLPMATETDALSTALIVLGEEGLPGLAAKFPDASFLIAWEDKDKRLQVTTVGDAFTLIKTETNV